MDENLINLLESFGYPVMRQGSLPEDQAYPDTFFTFWNSEEIEHSAYDNDTSNINYNFDVNIYSTDIDLCISLLEQARTLLKANNWIIGTRGYDLASDEITHVGKGMQVYFLEQL